MGNIKRNGLLSAYLANVPVSVSLCSNFFSGVVCRLILKAFLSQTVNIVNICLCIAAILFSAAAINVTAYFMSMALCFRRRETAHHRVPVDMILCACAFVLGAAAAPQMMLLLSHG